MVRLACTRCDRKGHYRKTTLIKQHGAETDAAGPAGVDRAVRARGHGRHGVRGLLRQSGAEGFRSRADNQ